LGHNHLYQNIYTYASHLLPYAKYSHIQNNPITYYSHHSRDPSKYIPHLLIPILNHEVPINPTLYTYATSTTTMLKIYNLYNHCLTISYKLHNPCPTIMTKMSALNPINQTLMNQIHTYLKFLLHPIYYSSLIIY